MKKLQKLHLKGDMTPLTKTDEGLLKGGFGDVDTNGGIQLFGTNQNCSKQNNKQYCDNVNCACNCKPSSGSMI